MRSTSSDSKAERLLIVGWDGADWDVLDPLMRDGYMPTLDEITRTGFRSELASTIPSHSWAAWSSFLTGMNPGRHGVYDFVEVDPKEPQRRIPISSGSIKSPTFLDSLAAAGRETRIANVPVTYPPFPVRGRLISGIAIPPGAGFVYPPEWATELDRRAPFPTNGMEWTAFEERPAELIAEAEAIEAQRTESFLAMLEGDWSVATCVYLLPDRLQHPFSRYLIKSHPQYQRLAGTELAESLRKAYGSLDHHLARLRSAAGRNVTTIVMSDHGFRAVTRRVNPNALLVELGFQSMLRGAGMKTALLKSTVGRALSRTRMGHLAKRKVRAPSVIDWSRTVAYQSGTGFGVSVNLSGREPGGIVPRRDYDRIREEIRDALLSYRDRETGTSPVRAVWSREELYQGPSTHLAPDLVIEWNELWDYKDVGGLSMRVDWPSGDHRREGILAAAGGRTVHGSVEMHDIADVAATALAFCGISPSGLDGRPIPEIAGDTGTVQVIPHAPARGSAALGGDDEDSIVEHLRGLGYVE